MATEIGRGVIPVTFDKNQIGRDLSSSVEAGASQSAGSIGSTFKKIAGIAAGAFGVIKTFDFLGDTIASARESNKVAAQSEAVIKSTGGAAGVTAKQFGDLANQIALKTGIDDEQIQSAENLLATFTNVKNQVGAGNDIFTQATSVITDMSVALGQDTSSSAIQLGKALNDPIKGVTALQRVGVSFTQQQRDQIKTLVDSGHTLDAQKLILGELNKEFGGSAEATATAGGKWSVFVDNIKESIGNFLIPALDAVATFGMTTLPVAFGMAEDAIGPVLERITTDVSDFVSGFTVGTDEIGSAQSTWAQWGATAYEWFLKVKSAAQPFVDFLRDNWKPVLIGAAVAVGLLTAPITTVVVGLTALYIKSQTFRDIVEQTRVKLIAFGVEVSDLARSFWQTFGPALKAIGSSVADFVRFFAERWSKISAAVTNVLNAIKIAIAVSLAPALLAWRYFHEQIMAIVTFAWNIVGGVVQTAVRVITDVFDVIISLLSGDWGGAWDAFKDIPAAAIDYVKGIFSSFLGFVVDFFSSLPSNIISAVGDLASTLGPKAWDLLTGFLTGLVDAYVDINLWFLGLPLTIGGYFLDALSWLRDAGWNIIHGAYLGLLTAASDIWSWVQGLPGALVNAMSGAKDWLVDVGKAIIQGIITGIRSAGPGILKAISDQIPGGFGIPGIPTPGSAGGGLHTGSNALGDVDWRGGWTWTGERGPELAWLPQHTRIFTAADSARIMRDSTGGHTFALTANGNVLVQDPQDVATGMRRVELLAGVR